MKKKIINFKDKFIKKIKRIKEEKMISSYFKDNRLFLVYVLVCVINSTLLRIFTMPTMENYLSIKPIIADIAVVTIIGVYITIDYSRKNFDEDEMNRIRPYMALTHYKFRARKVLLGNNTPVETENQGDFYEEYKLERIYIVLNESSIEIKDKLEKDQLDILMSGGMHWESGSNGRAALRSYPYISYPFKVENVGCGAAINTVIGFCEEQKPRRGVSVFTLKPGDSAYLHIFCEDAKKIGNKRYVLDFSYYDTRGNGYSQKFLLNLYYDAYTDTAKGTIDLAGDQVSLL